MKMRNRFAAILMGFIFIALIPWIWLSNNFGLENIPHYDITMWIFMELYALICGVIFLGIVLLIYSDGDEEPPKKKKRNKNKNKNKKKPRKSTPKKPKTKDDKKEKKSSDSPEIWDRKVFE